MWITATIGIDVNSLDGQSVSCSHYLGLMQATTRISWFYVFHFSSEIPASHGKNCSTDFGKTWDSDIHKWYKKEPHFNGSWATKDNFRRSLSMQKIISPSTQFKKSLYWPWFRQTTYSSIYFQDFIMWIILPFFMKMLNFSLYFSHMQYSDHFLNLRCI